MITNVGGLDRLLRFVVGVALMALALGFGPGLGPQLWGWIGIVPLATALLGWCPLYSMLGIRTCTRPSRG